MKPGDFQLEKRLWTDSDFERMGWHDCPVRGLSTLSQFPERLELILDIDYIFEWIKPEGARPFKFRVSPATLVFENVHSLEIAIKSGQGELELDDIRRDEAQTSPTGETKYWRWTIELHQGHISLLSSGYKQFIRKRPILKDGRPELTEDERGGVSFDRSFLSRE
jgi:hypothetical protein